MRSVSANPDLVTRVRLSSLPTPEERRLIRHQANVTLEEIAAEVGVGPMTVWRWEQGLVRPRRESAIRYRNILRRLAKVSRG